MSTNTDLVPFEGKFPALLQQHLDDADDLTSGVSGGFGVISFRGCKWRVKFQGEEQPVLDQNGDPVATLEVVLLKANAAISKNFYIGGYVEGSTDQPDCMSLDGIVPEPGVPNQQSPTCAKCPQNVFGSRMTPAGKKAKACSDNRRMAVVPTGDMLNESFGGPMLLRIPAASLADLKQFGETLKRRGYPYNAVSVKLGFDMDVAYPKITFKAVRPLSDAEAQIVVEHLQGDIVPRILATAVEVAAPTAEAAPAEDEVFEQPPVAAPRAQPMASPKPAAKPATAVPAQAKPQPAPAAKPAATVTTIPRQQPQPAAAQPAAAKPRGATFGTTQTATPKAAPAAAKPAAPARRPAAAAPAPVQQELEVGTEDPTEGGGLDQEIESILGDLDSLTN